MQGATHNVVATVVHIFHFVSSGPVVAVASSGLALSEVADAASVEGIP